MPSDQSDSHVQLVGQSETQPTRVVTDEMVDRALWVYDEIDATADPEARSVVIARALMRKALEAALMEQEASDV